MTAATLAFSIIALISTPTTRSIEFTRTMYDRQGSAWEYGQDYFTGAPAYAGDIGGQVVILVEDRNVCELWVVEKLGKKRMRGYVQLLTPSCKESIFFNQPVLHFKGLVKKP